jgi:proteasome lid subunit RPN8/RPN11
MLTLHPEAEAAMRTHAEAGYPLEVCGFLVGSARWEAEPPGEREACLAWPVRNTWEEDAEARAALVQALEIARPGTTSPAEWEAHDARRRFLVSPQEVLAAMRRARDEGQDLVGVYHTHPEHPAVPSEFDRQAAAPGWSYVILSVRRGAVTELRSWVLDETEERFREEAVAPAG